MSSKISPFQTYAILHGFSNGRKHSANLRTLLKQAGYKESETVATADVIIAHSAGCYRIPAENRAKLALLVGVPMNKGRLGRTFITASKQNFATFHAAGYSGIRSYRGLLWSASDLFVHPLKNYQLVQTVKKYRHLLPVVLPTHAIVISNKQDAWPEPVRELAADSDVGYSFLSLTGSHGHVWRAPEEYVEIIEAYAARLLA